MEISNSYSQYSSLNRLSVKTNSLHAQENTPGQQQSASKITSPPQNTEKSENQNDRKKAAPNSDEKPFTQQVAQSLDKTELKLVEELKRRDIEVRAHEAAHLAAAGKHATSGASFDYKRGPDGKSYAAGGEVSIDTSPVPNDPQATLRKAQQIQAAARAPANPSAQDRQVAAQAGVMAADARLEITQQRVEGETLSGTEKNEIS